jgi:hypothetical protein
MKVLGTPFVQHSAESFHESISSLYRLPSKGKKPPATVVSLKKMKKGFKFDLLKRDPKKLLISEVAALAASVGLTIAEVEALCKKRKIFIVESLDENPLTIRKISV